jgi:hypothetical protein
MGFEGIAFCTTTQDIENEVFAMLLRRVAVNIMQFA